MLHLVTNAANETILLTTRCSKRKIADGTQDSLPIGKKHHSQSIRTLLSAYNEQLSTTNEASKDKTSMNKRKHGKCPYDKSKVSQILRILGKFFSQTYVQESTSGNEHLTETIHNCNLHHMHDLPDLLSVTRPCPPTLINSNIGTRRITIQDERILKPAFSSRWLQHVNS
jgi:hypothetical protein